MTPWRELGVILGLEGGAVVNSKEVGFCGLVLVAALAIVVGRCWLGPAPELAGLAGVEESAGAGHMDGGLDPLPPGLLSVEGETGGVRVAGAVPGPETSLGQGQGTRREDVGAVPLGVVRILLPPGIAGRVMDGSGSVGMEVRIPVSAKCRAPVRTGSAWSSVGDGVFEFDVELGLVFDVSVRAEGVDGFVRETVRGPTIEGQVVEHRIETRGFSTVYRGRLLNDLGMAIEAPSAKVAFPAPPPSRSKPRRVDLKLDPNGFFEFELSRDRISSIQRPVVFEHWAPELTWLLSRVKVRLPQVDSGEPVDLGEIRFPAPRVWLAGRAVDDSGAPVAGAEVTLTRSMAHATPSNMVRRGGAVFPNLPFKIPLTDERGEFELLAYDDGGGECEFIVKVSARGFAFQQEFRVPSGSFGVVLPLTEAGGVSGSYRLGDQLSARDLHVRIERPWDDEPGARGERSGLGVGLDGEGVLEVDLARDGSFEAPRIRSGRIILQLVDRDGRVHHTSEPVEVVAGQNRGYGRLRNVEVGVGGGR